MSSSSIFDHVDRLSRGSSDGNRRQANKVQLIAMQPRSSPTPPHSASQLSPTLDEKVNTEVDNQLFSTCVMSSQTSSNVCDIMVLLQVALRHKSEIEHHRNKLRQRAKRRGQCEFPSMDDIMDAFGDGPVQSEVAQRLYSSAHDHMDCILQGDTPSPPTPTDSRKRSDFLQAALSVLSLFGSESDSPVVICLYIQRETISLRSTGSARTRKSS